MVKAKIDLRSISKTSSNLILAIIASNYAVIKAVFKEDDYATFYSWTYSGTRISASSDGDADTTPQNP